MNQSDFDSGPMAEVDAQPTGDRWTLVFVRQLNHLPDKVWKALVDPVQLGEWAPFTADRELDQTGAATLIMLDTAAPVELSGAVKRAEAPHLLEYSWGDDVVRWELTAKDGGTRLTLRHTMNDRESLPMIAAGWHLCMAVAERLLDGNPIPPIRGAEAMNHGWQDLNEDYAEELGIAATELPE